LSLSTPPSPVPRLPGSAASTSRLCSTRGRVRPGLVLPAPSAAPLFGFQSPPGRLLRSPAPVPRRHPLMTLPPWAFTLTHLGRLQRLSTAG
jgi:hypothetical protein